MYKVINDNDWSKLQTTLAFFILATVGAFASFLIAVWVLWSLRSTVTSSVFLGWFIANIITFVFGFVGIWPFAMYMGDAGGRYGNGFSVAVVAVCLFFSLSIGTYWARTQHMAETDGAPRSTRRKHRKKGKKARMHAEDSDEESATRLHPIFDVTGEEKQ